MFISYYGLYSTDKTNLSAGVLKYVFDKAGGSCLSFCTCNADGCKLRSGMPKPGRRHKCQSISCVLTDYKGCSESPYSFYFVLRYYDLSSGFYGIYCGVVTVKLCALNAYKGAAVRNLSRIVNKS